MLHSHYVYIDMRRLAYSCSRSHYVGNADTCLDTHGFAYYGPNSITSICFAQQIEVMEFGLTAAKITQLYAVIGPSARIQINVLD